MEDIKSVNLGSVYENVVAQELRAHGFDMFYYDNKKNGEVDFLIDDTDNMSVLPIEIKSGKDYRTHSALSRFVQNGEFGVRKAYVLSNERLVYSEADVTYMPVYYVMFLHE